MVLINGYQILTQIYQSTNSLVYRGLRETDRQAVILKFLEDYPSSEQITRYKQEYEITRNLQLDGVIKSYSLEKYQRTLTIVFEDFGGESLKRLMAERKIILADFLPLSLKITESLSSIHSANIIHKDINPSNIVFNPETGRLKIIDFGISALLNRETPNIKNPHVLSGTLAYMSPEQTGRMSRALDYRTDFYSLGVTFYELLTHQLPFDTTDPMELVHCHIALMPKAPHELNPEIPLAVSDIVMKLLAKTAEERYQSAWGIKADLEECLTQLQASNKISQFPLSRQDISDKFQIPQKLYGREREIETLLAVFERVAGEQQKLRRLLQKEPHTSSTEKAAPQRRGAKIEMMLVSGYSGIGKSALVQEIYKPITRQRGYFISGKFDQFQRNIPYSAFVSAFSDLMRQLLTETHIQLQQWQEKLLAALGDNGQVVIDVIPEVELIVGKQPSVLELPPNEAQNRFGLVFQSFIRVFTKPEHPLVIFLDDLQWADAASLKLIQLLMTDSVNQHLFFIGAYRDNEVNNAHPLMLIIDEIRKSGTGINQISLSPLPLTVVEQLIADTLKCCRERVETLAELVLAKTNGNPFFINEFLKSLYTEKLLKFDYEQSSWQWNIEQIKARGITDNVVELMAGKIKTLNTSTQQVLQLAACVGNQFDLQRLAIISEKSQKETHTELYEAIAQGLVLPLSDAYKMIELDVPTTAVVEYKFAHDRIQQAAYSLITEEQKKQTHLKIGQLLLKNISHEEREANIFDIVNQLNVGAELILDQLEKSELASLNLIAGRKAVAAAAYEPALRYLNVGLGLLAKDSWEIEYDLTLALYAKAAEAAYFCTNFEQMEQFASAVLQQAHTPLDKLKAYEVKIQAYIAQNQAQAALKIALEILELLGVNLPMSPSKLNLLLDLQKTKLALAGKRIENLIDLPQMTDPVKLAAMQILASIISAAYVTVPPLYSLIVFKQVNLSLKHGNASFSTYAYSSYGAIICSLLGDIESAHQFGQLALKLLERFNARELKAKTFVGVYIFLRHWKEHVRETLKPLQEGYQSGLETGDIEYATICIHVYCYSAYFSGKELTAFEPEMTTYSNAIQQLKQATYLNYNQIYRQAVLNLLGTAVDPCHLSGESYNEEKMLPLHQQANDRTAICKLYVNKLILCYLFHKFSQAVENAVLAEKYLDSVPALLVFPIFHFYDSLARLAVYTSADKYEQKRILKKVTANQKKLKKWAHYAPMNYLHKFYLVEAEQHRVVGQKEKATDLYDQAIELAKDNEYINEEALANELTAKFYLDRGKNEIAQAYLMSARYCYQRWGATRKVKDLDERYPQLLCKISQVYTRDTIVTNNTTSSSSSEALDFITVVKSSQAISSEILLDKLLAKLMKIVIENAGAQKGYLILSKNQQLFIETAGIVEPATEIVRQSMPMVNSQELPITLINYVERTKETVVLDSATASSFFMHDPYIIAQKPKSILCAPILSQGKLLSIVYLENNLTIGAFTSERLEVLRLLCSQAAVSIENAQLYEQLENYSHTLEQKVTERTLELQAKNEQLQQEIHDRTVAEAALQRANQQLSSLACLDGLTQIANRRRFDEYLCQEWQRSLRENTPLSFLLCDVDYFKRYNDTYGHQAGDACLQQVAQAISGVAKRPADLVARYGGEEFAVILSNTNAEGAIQVARSINLEVQQLQIPHSTSSVCEYVTLSVGVSSTIPRTNLSPEALIAVADKALYDAKQGRNRAVLGYNSTHPQTGKILENIL